MVSRAEFHVEAGNIQRTDDGEDANIIVNQDWRLGRHRHGGNGTDTDENGTDKITGEMLNDTKTKCSAV